MMWKVEGGLKVVLAKLKWCHADMTDGVYNTCCWVISLGFSRLLRVMIRASSSLLGCCEVLPLESGDAFKHTEPRPGESSPAHPDLHSALFLVCFLSHNMCICARRHKHKEAHWDKQSGPCWPHTCNPNLHMWPVAFKLELSTIQCTKKSRNSSFIIYKQTGTLILEQHYLDSVCHLVCGNVFKHNFILELCTK